MKCTHRDCKEDASRDFTCKQHGAKNCIKQKCRKLDGRYARCEYHYKAIHHGTRYAAKPHMDYDYLHKLNPEELAFLDKFNQEHYLDSFGKVVDLKSSKKLSKPIQERKKKAHDDSNSRRRCLILKHAVPLADYKYHNTENPIDAWIEKIDLINGHQSDEE